MAIIPACLAENRGSIPLRIAKYYRVYDSGSRPRLERGSASSILAALTKSVDLRVIANPMTDGKTSRIQHPT